MIPEQTGYYWLLLTPASRWQVVYVIRGEDVLYPGLSERSTRTTFDAEYPHARWSDRLRDPYWPDKVDARCERCGKPHFESAGCPK